MNTRKMRMFPLLFLVALTTACASRGFEADVTRFHDNAFDGQSGQSVTIRPAREALDGLEFAQYAALVGEKLGAVGFTAAGEATPDLIAQLDYLITPIASAEKESGRLSIGGGSFGRHGGISSGVSFPVGETSRDTVFRRRIDLVLINAETGKHLWEGRAISTGKVGDPAIILPLLAEALLQDFPGVSGRTIEVTLSPDQ